MLLFHKRDLLVTLTLVDNTVTFSKPVKDILKYQHRYNYKFKLYETGKVTVSDDYIIEGETLTVFFGSAYVEYSSSGATYNDGGSGGGSGGGGAIPEYEIKFLPIDVGEGYYIDGDPAEITSGSCILVFDTAKYFPVSMVAEDGFYSLVISTNIGMNSEAIADYYYTGAVENAEYADKLVCITGGTA